MDPTNPPTTSATANIASVTAADTMAMMDDFPPFTQTFPEFPELEMSQRQEMTNNEDDTNSNSTLVNPAPTAATEPSDNHSNQTNVNALSSTEHEEKDKTNAESMNIRVKLEPRLDWNLNSCRSSAAFNSPVTLPLPPLIPSTTPTESAVPPTANTRSQHNFLQSIGSNRQHRMITQTTAIPTPVVAIIPPPVASNQPLSQSQAENKRKQPTPSSSTRKTHSSKKRKSVPNMLDQQEKENVPPNQQQPNQDVPMTNDDSSQPSKQPSNTKSNKRQKPKHTTNEIDELVDLSPSTQPTTQLNVVASILSTAIPMRATTISHSNTNGSSSSISTTSSSSLAPAADAKTCLICTENYTSEGRHRVCCLKCGHLFGENCIERWLIEKKSCPQCKKKAVIADVRRLFIPGVVVLDNSINQAANDRIQTLNMEVVQLKSQNGALSEELTKVNRKYDTLSASYNRLQNKLMGMVNASKSANSNGLTYIMSPTIHPPLSSPVVDYTRDPPPSSFQYAPITLGQSTSSTVPPLPSTGFGHSQIHPPCPSPFPQPPHQNPITSSVARSPIKPHQLEQSQTISTFSRHSIHLPAQLPSMSPIRSTSTTTAAPTTTSTSLKTSPIPGLNELAFPMIDMFGVESGRCVDFDEVKGHIFLSAVPVNYPTTNDWTCGVMKSHVEDIATRHYMPLHSKPIRDLQFHSSRQLMLSGSFDKTVKISSLNHGTIAHTFTQQQPVWSCSWNSWNEHLIHAGLQDGAMVTYDIRQSAAPLVTLQLQSKAPIHSIVSIGSAADPSDALRGVIASTAAHVTLFKSTQDGMNWNTFDLPVASITGMSTSSVAYDPVSHAGVCATRPSSAATVTPATANGFTLNKPTASSICTVFRIDKGGTQGTTNTSTTATASLSSSSSHRRPRWCIPIQSSAQVNLDYLHPFQLDAHSLNLECTCLSQLTGHQQRMAFSRVAIWSTSSGQMSQSAKNQIKTSPKPSDDSATHRRILVGAGDEATNQCVIWDGNQERIFARLVGQQSPIMQVKHSNKLNMLATVSENLCCLYRDGTDGN